MIIINCSIFTSFAYAATCLHTNKMQIGITEERIYTYSPTNTVCYFYKTYKNEICLLCNQRFTSLIDTVTFNHIHREVLIGWDDKWYYLKEDCSRCGVVFKYYQVAKKPGQEPW